MHWFGKLFIYIVLFCSDKIIYSVSFASWFVVEFKSYSDNFTVSYWFEWNSSTATTRRFHKNSFSSAQLLSIVYIIPLNIIKRFEYTTNCHDDAWSPRVSVIGVENKHICWNCPYKIWSIKYGIYAVYKNLNETTWSISCLYSGIWFETIIKHSH